MARGTKAVIFAVLIGNALISLNTNPIIENVNEVLPMHMGTDFILANMSVDFVEHSSADEIETVVAEIDERIKERSPQIKRIFIEAEKSKIG